MTNLHNFKLSEYLYIVPCEVKNFAVIMTDDKKKNNKDNTANAGFFASYTEEGSAFTLPVAHLKCDYGATNKWTRHYCEERGKFNGDKFTFDSSGWSYQNPMYKKDVSSLIVDENGRAYMDRILTIPNETAYVISGVPVILAGKQVSYQEALNEGWDASNMRATWHTMLGLKGGDEKIYIIGWQSVTSNLLSSGEAYSTFAPLGFSDLIKLDGGGSFILNVNGQIIETSENRRINSVVSFVPWTAPEESETPEQPEEPEVPEEPEQPETPEEPEPEEPTETEPEEPTETEPEEPESPDEPPETVEPEKPEQTEETETSELPKFFQILNSILDKLKELIEIVERWIVGS